MQLQLRHPNWRVCKRILRLWSVIRVVIRQIGQETATPQPSRRVLVRRLNPIRIPVAILTICSFILTVIQQASIGAAALRHRKRHTLIRMVSPTQPLLLIIRPTIMPYPIRPQQLLLRRVISLRVIHPILVNVVLVFAFLLLFLEQTCYYQCGNGFCAEEEDEEFPHRLLCHVFDKIPGRE